MKAPMRAMTNESAPTAITTANLNRVHLRQLLDEKVLSQFDVKHDVGSDFAHSEQQRVSLLRRHPVLDQPILGPTREGALEVE